jgi:hypothetical protein
VPGAAGKVSRRAAFALCALLALRYVLSLADPGIEGVPTRIAGLVLVPDRVRRKHVQQKRFDSCLVLIRPRFTAARERFGGKPLGKKNAAGLIDVGHVVAPCLVDE